MPKGQFILLGVILSEDKKIAMLREIATGKVFRLEQGKEINGMQLEKLEPEKITLKQGDEREELTLKIQPSTKQQVAAAPPANPPRPGESGTPAAPVQAEAPAVPVQADAQGGPLTPQQQYIARRRALHMGHRPRQ
jgi:type II secretory pathway component PulC